MANKRRMNLFLMATTSALRLQIERSLEGRFPAALTPVQRAVCEVAATGIASVDDLLEGGLPIGAISEITGANSSGRTSIALSFIAQRTQDGQVCAWVDVSDTLDPESAAACGVGLPRLLWVRCKDATNAKGKPWSRLDQAIRATDLLLQAAGFGAIVLDLGNTAAEYGRRIPLATWFRYRQAAQRSRTSLVVVGRRSYAQSSAEVVLECKAHPGAAGRTVLKGLVFEVHRQRKRFQYAAVPATGKKPPVSTWSISSQWTDAAAGIARP